MKPDSTQVHAVVPSPNFGDRQGRRIDALILHYTGMRTGAAARARLLDPASQVSCHYLVWEDGRIEQLVAESQRAWHAGQSFWAGERDMNSVSIGIEIVNGGHEGGCPPYPTAQIDAVVALARDICARHTIAPARVLGHSDVAPGRKRDPGEWFPWRMLEAAGITKGIVVSSPDRPPTVSHDGVSAALREIGYDCPEADTSGKQSQSAVSAFQRRYRPTRVDGVVDRETRALLEAIR